MEEGSSFPEVAGFYITLTVGMCVYVTFQGPQTLGTAGLPSLQLNDMCYNLSEGPHEQVLSEGHILSFSACR